jgi:hypothetical protein
VKGRGGNPNFGLGKARNKNILCSRTLGHRILAWAKDKN